MRSTALEFGLKFVRPILCHQIEKISKQRLKKLSKYETIESKIFRIKNSK